MDQAVGKDPGLSPLSLLDLLERHGRYRPEDSERLHLVGPFDLTEAKSAWLSALEGAERFACERPPEEFGCLYYSASEARFVIPRRGETLEQQGIVVHFATWGGVLPRIADQRIED